MKYFSGAYFEELRRLALAYLTRNYDYCYLDSMHEKNRRLGADTVVAGSSHAMNGILEKCFDTEIINFSVSSQDIYYDFHHIKKACREGKQPIKNCIINVGYYMFFQDLSLSKNSNYLVRTVYEPLFHDSHFMQIDSPYHPMQEAIESGRDVFSAELLETFCREWVRNVLIEQGSYYGELICREKNNVVSLKGIVWERLSESEKDAYARKRAADHNRLFAHKESRTENGRLVEEMAAYLAERDIRIIFVIFPFTGWYNQYINPEYREDIYRALDGLKTPVEFLDMNGLDCFHDGDFLDTDHLNDAGAQKASKILNAFLRDV